MTSHDTLRRHLRQTRPPPAPAEHNVAGSRMVSAGSGLELLMCSSDPSVTAIFLSGNLFLSLPFTSRRNVPVFLLAASKKKLMVGNTFRCFGSKQVHTIEGYSMLCSFFISDVYNHFNATLEVDSNIQEGAWARHHATAVTGPHSDHTIRSPSRWLPTRSPDQELLVKASDWEPAGRAPDHATTAQANHSSHMTPNPCSSLDTKVHFVGSALSTQPH